MAKTKLDIDDLNREVNDFHEQFPKLVDDQLFVLWFLRAYITQSEAEAAAALAGVSGDKEIDAVLLDSDTHTVCIIQGKYHKKLAAVNEKHTDVTGFAQRAQTITGSDDEFAAYVTGMAPEVAEKIAKARSRAMKDKYRLRLYYVTTGKCSKGLAKEAEEIAQQADYPATCEVIDWRRLLEILDYYLRDIALPINSIDMEMEGGEGVDVKDIYHRYDATLDIESWVFSMTARGIATMFDQAHKRLFALNIRGYQGDTTINQGIEKTLKDEPEHFWYYNNGLTVICDGAQKISSHGRDVLHVEHPQVINGQQTTLTIAQVAAKNTKATVTVRVIRIPHDADGGTSHFDTLVPRIVEATNWQNAIITPDLVIVVPKN